MNDPIQQWLAAGGRIVLLPGWRNSGPEHWQSQWQARYPEIERVEQADWEHPVAAHWVRALDAQLGERDAPVILVAHSLGCATVAHWSALYGRGGRVAGALLVAPADVRRPSVPHQFTGFVPLPHKPLPFPTLLIASDDDPTCHLDRATAFAEVWGARQITLAGAGHINVDSGHGAWPQGIRFLRQVLQSARRGRLHQPRPRTPRPNAPPLAVTAPPPPTSLLAGRALPRSIAY
ncbi:RBBP9/YdeN family alpha/beta hydrolase [Chitiniphilus shinanonensis]|uniref:RBBP9/YdeN family alpha/beta hydrolase n=1 Tax=Chitiniphilus shinanonensis TaxID=553088 RepID=UPI0003654A4C|nr:alpha/beta hydrolase [Chitiniphilus shinanonensis]